MGNNKKSMQMFSCDHLLSVLNRKQDSQLSEEGARKGEEEKAQTGARRMDGPEKPSECHRHQHPVGARGGRGQLHYQLAPSVLRWPH